MKLTKMLQKIKPILFQIIRMLWLFVGLAIVPAFWNTLIGKDHFYHTVYFVVCLVFFVLYYNSFIRLKTTYNDALYEKFKEELNEESTKREYLAFLFCQKDFWLQYAITALLFVLFPIRTTAPVFAWLFGAYGNFDKELLALSVFVPFLFVVYAFAHISAIDYWQQLRGAKRDNSKKTKRNTYISMIFAYAVVPFAVLMIWNIVTQYLPLVFELFKISSSVGLVVFVFFVVAFVLFYSFFRVLLARKKCIKAILRVCKEKNFDITPIKHPYLSAFHVCRGESFLMTVRGKTYSCKLVGAPRRMVPLVVHPAGGLHFMHSFQMFKTPIVSHTVVKDFGYDSEHTKILIINPVPKKLFCYFGNRVEEIDNGALVGDYKIYTATAFVRAIDTDTIER